MLKLRRYQLLLTFGLAIWSTTSSAAFIQVVDVKEGVPPVVTTDLTDEVIRSFVEGTTISGLVSVGPTGGLVVPAGVRAVALTEPAGDFNPPISDLITLRAGDAIIQRPDGFFQEVALSFLSDSVGSVPVPPGITPTLIPELDQLQNITIPLNSGALEVHVQSDFFTPEVPEPAAILTMGIGLAVLVGLRLRKV